MGQRPATWFVDLRRRPEAGKTLNAKMLKQLEGKERLKDQLTLRVPVPK